MRSLKAITAGCAFIVVMGLLIQLAYIFFAVVHIYLAKSYPFLNDVGVYFKYLIGFPVFFFLMFAGGYVTADLSPQNIIRNCLLVAMITMSFSMLSALSYSEITITGLIVLFVALISTVMGGLYWRYSQLKNHTAV
ncbi:MAG: hypothetical protein OQK76_02160 [Gammaproteobacteria bacterium]|nr:hypothetical protein [Gammaproteobacteria bacterium]MCW8909402.1 hypothetical protein [Gammaproteobacteria bacterium]MCW9004228.1 hypothetical protein [Gammaproteobacteria bacterium]MCW9055197.1 hypothetical protein [Gammaproteobacteria bacterium]